MVCGKVVLERWCWWCVKDGVWQSGEWKMVWENVKDGVWQSGMWKIVCDKVVCARWCVKKLCVKDGVGQSGVKDGVSKLVCQGWCLKDGVRQIRVRKIVCQSWCGGSAYCACHAKGSRGPAAATRAVARPGGSAATRAATPPGGSVYCACHTKGSRGPVVATRAAAPPEGSVYCACHTRGSRTAPEWVSEWGSECEGVNVREWMWVSECEWVNVSEWMWVSECEWVNVSEWMWVSECEWVNVSEWMWVSECEWVNVSEWVSEWVGEWVGEWVSEWVSECVRACVSEWVREWVRAWVRACVREWVSEWWVKWRGGGGGGGGGGCPGGIQAKNKNPTQWCGEKYRNQFRKKERAKPIITAQKKKQNKKQKQKNKIEHKKQIQHTSICCRFFLFFVFLALFFAPVFFFSRLSFAFSSGFAHFRRSWSPGHLRKKKTRNIKAKKIAVAFFKQWIVSFWILRSRLKALHNSFVPWLWWLDWTWTLALCCAYFYTRLPAQHLASCHPHRQSSLLSVVAVALEAILLTLAQPAHQVKKKVEMMISYDINIKKQLQHSTITQSSSKLQVGYCTQI